jgi:hypothetical protein
MQEAAAIDFDGTDGTITNPIRFIGVNDDTTNQPPQSSDLGTNRFIIDAQSVASRHAARLNGVSHYHFLNIDFRNSGSSANGLDFHTAFSYFCMFVNCAFRDNTGYGVDSNLTLSRATVFKQCLFIGNGDGCLCSGATYGDTYIACRFVSNTSKGAYPYYHADFIGCVFEQNGTSGAQARGAGVFVGCVFDGQSGIGDFGFKGDTAAGGLVCLGCRFTNNDTGFEIESYEEVFIDYCYLDDAISGPAIEIPDKTDTTHNTESGSDTNDGYVTSELNLDPNEATYFNEALIVPSS